MSPNFNYLRKQVRAENFFKDFKFNCTLDCSQSPYFSVGFSRPIRFDGAATILVCKSKHDLGRVSKLPRGGEQSWEAAGKKGETVTASHCLVFEGCRNFVASTN